MISAALAPAPERGADTLWTLRRLGDIGFLVSELSLGTLTFGAWGQLDEYVCKEIVHRAIDAGISLIDTADVYSGGQAERILGDALRRR